MQKRKNVVLTTSAISDSKNFSDALKKRIYDITTYGKRASGQANYLKFLQGGRLSASQAMRCMCYLCLGMAADGTYDCKDSTCPAYPWNPYKTVNVPRAPNRAIPEKNGNGSVCSDVGKNGGDA